MKKDNNNQSLINKLIAVLLRLPWADVFGDALKALRKAIQGRSYRSLYEVLEYESTLELKDREGKRATFKKREKVRYLQDRWIAERNQAWVTSMAYRTRPCVEVEASTRPTQDRPNP
jgi:hypothetical protein